MPKNLYSDKRTYKKITIPRKKGISWWRHILTGVYTIDGVPASLFIEYVTVNPSLSPKAVVKNSKPEEISAPPAISEKKTAKRSASQKPSYVLVRAGFFGNEGIIFECFFPSVELSYKKTEKKLLFKDCILSNSEIAGSIAQNSVIYSLFSDAQRKDTFSWDLAFKEDTILNACIAYNDFNWLCSGAKTFVNGNIQVNNKLFTIADTSFCYLDKAHGNEIPDYWFHLSGVHMISKITNKKLDASCFIVQGFSAEKITIFLALENIHLSFKPKRFARNIQASSCVKNEDKIHWMTSAQNESYMLDIDIFCAVPDMKLRNYDSPNGQGLFLCLLTGSSGIGEVRLYKRRKKNLELIEHVDILDAHCEFGGKDTLDI